MSRGSSPCVELESVTILGSTEVVVRRRRLLILSFGLIVNMGTTSRNIRAVSIGSVAVHYPGVRCPRYDRHRRGDTTGDDVAMAPSLWDLHAFSLASNRGLGFLGAEAERGLVCN